MEHRPGHAYVPGTTPRHAEDAFDVLRDTARAGMSPQALAGCDAFRVGLAYLNGGYYWEAHELLEPVWMVLPDPSVERAFVQGLIQIANGYLKIEMHKPKAAGRLVRIARALIADGDGMIMGVRLRDVHDRIDVLERRVNCAI